MIRLLIIKFELGVGVAPYPMRRNAAESAVDLNSIAIRLIELSTGLKRSNLQPIDPVETPENEDAIESRSPDQSIKMNQNESK